MKKVKVFFVVIIAMGLLIIVAFAPIMLSKWNDNRILSEVVIEKIKSNDVSMTHTSKLSTKEKIELLCDYNYKNQNFVVISQRQTKSKADFEKIKEGIMEETKKLQNLKVIPEFDFNEDYEEYTWETITYAKATDPESCVVVMQMNFYNEENNLNIWVDGNDNTIYRCNYYGKNIVSSEPFNIYDEDIQTNYGIKYLGLSDEEMSEYCFAVVSKKMIDIGIIN